ncbi:hypothetical protein AB3X55_08250 [Alphaproteobacteria bacterium LSUCC0719]
MIGVVSMAAAPDYQGLWANGKGSATIVEMPPGRRGLRHLPCGQPGRRGMVDPTEILGGWSEFTVTPPSEYFLNCLRSVGEATALNGDPAYQPDIVTQLITTIASRGYGPLLFRTVHVMSAAAMMEIRLDQLLVTDRPLTARQAQRILMSPATPPPALKVNDGMLEFVEPGTKDPVFKLGSQQVPLATACLEFLVEALGFTRINEAFATLADDTGAAARKAVTKDLSNRLYHFLGEHLPQAAERNLARILAEHLEAEVGAPAFAAEDIDDQLILDFWLDKSLDETMSFRLFGTAARAWLTFRDCLIRSRGDGFDIHLSLSIAHEDEDFDRLSQLAVGAGDDSDGATAALGQLVGDEATPANWLADLQRPPCDEIKFLTKTELAQIAIPAMAGRTGHNLVLTCLRLAAFGPLQNRLVQASRNKTLQPADIEREMTAMDDAIYADLLAGWQALRTVAEDIATTAYLRLWEEGDVAIFEFLSQQADEDTRQEMASIAADLQRQLASQTPDEDLDDDPVTRLAIQMLGAMDQLPSDSAISITRQKMKRTAQSYRRQGLRSTDRSEPPTKAADRSHALACGGDRLLKLAAMLTRMSHPDPSPASRITGDLTIFGTQFTQLHETAA